MKSILIIIISSVIFFIPLISTAHTDTEAFTAFSMGYFYLYNDDYKKALTQFERCLRLEGDPPAVLYTILAEVNDMLGNKEEAERYASMALEVDAENETALHFKALFLMDRKEYKEAIRYLDQLRQKRPHDLQVLLLIAEIYGNLEEEEKLIDIYREILIFRPELIDVHLNLGYLYTKKGLLQRAKEEYEKVLEMDGENEKAIFYLTYIYLSEGNTEKALSYFQKLDSRELLNDEMLEDYAANLFIEDQDPRPALMRIDDKEKTGPITRGIGLYIDGDLVGAKELFETGIRENPDNIAGYVGLIRIAEKNDNIDMEKKWRFVLAGVYYDLHSWEKAFDQALRVKEIDPNYLENRYLLGDIYRSLGMTENAVAEYEFFRSRAGEKGDVFIKLGLCYDELGDHEAAVRNFQSAIELLPQNADLHYYLGIEYRILENYEKAISSFHKAIELGGENAYFYFNLGVSYERAGMIDDAIIHLDKSVQLDNANAVALNYLGYLLADRGIRLEEAKGFIEKALLLDPDNGAYLDSIGWVYFKLLEYEKAQVYLEKAVLYMDLSEEENYVIYDHLGDTYHKLGLRSKAIETWKKALELKYIEEIQKKLENLERVTEVQQ